MRRLAAPTGRRFDTVSGRELVRAAGGQLNGRGGVGHESESRIGHIPFGEPCETIR